MEYPTANALDDYAIGFVKGDVAPPKNVYTPVLPEGVKASSGSEQLMVPVSRMSGAWASVYLKMASEKGYNSNILAGHR